MTKCIRNNGGMRQFRKSGDSDENRCYTLILDVFKYCTGFMNDHTKIKLIQSVSFFVGASGEIGLGVGAGLKGGLFAGIEANEKKGTVDVIAYWTLEFSISINVGANVIVAKITFCNGIDIIQEFVAKVTGISFFG